MKDKPQKTMVDLSKVKSKSKVFPADNPMTRVDCMLPAPMQRFGTQAILIIVIGFAFYSNSIKNEYAFDDDIVILQNQYVKEGFDGIFRILTRDAYDSYLQQMQAQTQLAGGRYRPLSIVTFAIEQQFLGNTPHFRHFMNVLIYIFSLIALLFLFRRYLLKDHLEIACLSVFLFAIHPIHTEVIANIKSRDEILSLLFISLTFIYAFKWQEENKMGALILALVCYFLALLSKEWGIAMVVLLPLSFYIVLKKTAVKCFQNSIPFFIVAVIYLIIRFNIVQSFNNTADTDILSNPYAWATPLQTIATKFFVLVKYIGLLFIPFPLSSDYSYSAIPYYSAGSVIVWVSIAVYAGLIISAIFFTQKRHILGFAFWFYLIHLFIVSNLVFNIGALMGERLLYHSSLGFCLAISWFIIHFLKKSVPVKFQYILLIILLLPVTCLAAFKTIQRNREWKDDFTLFTRDAKYTPQSTIINLNAGKGFIEKFEKNPDRLDSLSCLSLLDSAAFYLHRAVTIYRGNYLNYINLGLIEAYKNKYDNLEYYWNQADSIFPRKEHPGFWTKYDIALSTALYSKGITFAIKQDYQNALPYLQRAIRYAPDSAQFWYNLGVVDFKLGNYQEAKNAWEKALKLNPDLINAQKGYQTVLSILNNQENKDNKLLK